MPALTLEERQDEAVGQAYLELERDLGIRLIQARTILQRVYDADRIDPGAFAALNKVHGKLEESFESVSENLGEAYSAGRERRGGLTMGRRRKVAA